MAKNAVGLAIATEEYGAKFFANGAAPGGVLEHPGTIKDPQKVKESWNSAYQGSQNAHRVAVLEEGMKYQPIGISPEQAFNVVEVSWMKDPKVRKQARSMLDTSHMTVAYGAQPRTLSTGLDVNSLDDSMRAKAIATLKEGIDEAYDLGAVGFSFVSGKYPGKDREEAACQALEDSIGQLCIYAKSKGPMPIVLEIFDRDIDKKSLVGPNDVALRIAENVRKEHDNFGLLVDLSHIPLLGQTPEEAAGACKGLPCACAYRKCSGGGSVTPCIWRCASEVWYRGWGKRC